MIPTRLAVACLATLVSAGLVAVNPAIAGPWWREGGATLEVGLSSFSADQSFVRGIPVDLAFTSLSLDLHADISLPNRFTLSLGVPFVFATNTAPSGQQFSNRSFGDGRFQVDYQLLENIPVALGLGAKVPFYRSVAEQGYEGLVQVNGALWPTESFPDVGDGNVDLTARVIGGLSFHPLPAWLTAELGYLGRLGGFADGVMGALNLGAFVWPQHISVSVYAAGTLNLEEDVQPEEQASREYLYLQGSLQITLAPWVPRLALNLAFGGIVLAEHSSTGEQLRVGFSYRL